ncbi:MAG: hypothetical protein FWG46_06095 [Treponema sp.]|nr:hypothetical protein [Treponema sp.]
MGFRSAGKAFLALVLLLALAGCGELDSLFPQSESYHVKAMINGNSLEDCSLIWAADEIRPYFAASVGNDPDLTGLLVYIQNSRGEVVGEKVLYSLQPYSGGAEAPNETAQEGGPAELAAEETPGNGAARGKWGFINTKAAEPDDAVVIVVASLDQEIPPFPIPENMEIGPYILVFEAIGKKETLCHSESAIFYLGNTEFAIKDITMYLPKVSDARLIPPGTTILLESNLDFDSRLEPYLIWYDGRTVISEGKMSEGAGSILWKAPERAGFYSLRLEVFPFKLRSNFSGVYREIALPVSSKATDGIRGYFFGEGPEYAGNSQLSSGTVFAELKLAEIEFEEDPDEENTPAVIERPELLRWYQFEGSLDDTTAWSDTERSLIPAGEKAALWTSVGQSYGLSTGPHDAYLLSPITFFRNAQAEGGGIFLFHVKTPAEGVIFSAFFPSQASEDEGLKMEILKNRNAVVLRLESGKSTAEIPVYIPPFETQAFIPAAVEFYIRPYRMEAKLSLDGNQSLHSAEGNIRLHSALAGESRIRLGGGAMPEGNPGLVQMPAAEESPAENASVEEILLEAVLDADDIESAINTAAAEADASRLAGEEVGKKENPVNTVWNEFAVLYSSLAILEEEIFPDPVAEADIEMAMEEAQGRTDEASAETAAAPAAETWSKIISIEVDRVYLSDVELDALASGETEMAAPDGAGDFASYGEGELPDTADDAPESGETEARIQSPIPAADGESDIAAETPTA